MRFPRGVPREFLEKGEREREREGGELSETGIICIVRAVRTHKFGTCILRRVELASLSRAGKDCIHGNVACICTNSNRKSATACSSHLEEISANEGNRCPDIVGILLQRDSWRDAIGDGDNRKGCCIEHEAGTRVYETKLPGKLIHDRGGAFHTV